MLRYIVSGVVQGVGFRYFVLRQAERLGITGWVRNLPDGRVEVVAAGAPEPMAELEGALHGGPSRSRVTGVEKSEILDEVDRPKTFEIR